MAVQVQLRILALTATPGCKLPIFYLCSINFPEVFDPYAKRNYPAKQPSIQSIIDNLHISTLEYRNESDHDVSPYVHNRNVELIEVHSSFFSCEVNYLCFFLMGLTSSF